MVINEVYENADSILRVIRKMDFDRLNQHATELILLTSVSSNKMKLFRT